jgi:hypothetical protein
MNLDLSATAALRELPERCSHQTKNADESDGGKTQCT